MNHISITGNLGKDPEMKFTPTGRKVTTFSVANNRRWTDDKGEKHEETTWLNIEAWNGLGETCAKYLQKGRKVLVEGRIDVRPYTDKDGARRDWVCITASNVEFLDAPRSETPPTNEDVPF